MRVVCFIATLLACLGSAQAQDFPSKPIHIVVGNLAGGGNDILARIVGQKLSERLGQPVVIENKAGASGAIAAQTVAKSPADGHTLLLAPIGTMTVNPAVIPDLPYSPQRDFAPISLIASFPLVVTVKADAPFANLSDLVAYAKASPDKANAGTSGVIFQLVQKMFDLRTGTSFQVVTYRSNTETMLALMRGDVMMALSDPGPVAGPLRGGSVRTLAVTSGKRILAWPGIPTMTEAGVKDMEIEFWSGLVAPAGTPPAIVRKLQDEIMQIVRLDDVRRRLLSLDVTPVGSTSDEFARTISRELPLWADIAKAANIKTGP